MLNFLIIYIALVIFILPYYFCYEFFLALNKKKKELSIANKKLSDWKKHCHNLETVQQYYMNHIDSLNQEIKEIKLREIS